jgi:undecaprenyl-diphosphatase
MINGCILFGGELLRRRDLRRQAMAPADVSPRHEALVSSSAPAPSYGPATEPDQQLEPGDRGTMLDEAAEQRLAGIGIRNALWIGASQILALLAGISREGITMVGGLTRGLNHEDALRFSFLLSTPVILAAGVLKISDLTGPLGAGVRGQIIAGSIAAAASSLFAVLFLARWFRTRTLVPFAVYCLLAGLISVIRFGLF